MFTRKLQHLCGLSAFLIFAAFGAFGQGAPSLAAIKKIYIEKMPNDLDQYLRAEISKQFKGRVTAGLGQE
jgi:hypothetical protein